MSRNVVECSTCTNLRNAQHTGPVPLWWDTGSMLANLGAQVSVRVYLWNAYIHVEYFHSTACTHTFMTCIYIHTHIFT